MGEGIKKIWKHRKLVAFFVIFMVVVLVGVAVYIRFFVYNDKAKVTTEYINGMLSKSSELTTAKLNYTGMTEYSDEGISVINKGDFVMVYRATVRAGINVDEIKSKVDDKNEIIYFNREIIFNEEINNTYYYVLKKVNEHHLATNTLIIKKY